MKKKAIVSSITLVSSLASYFYAKSQGKDIVPAMLIGGFIGGLVGEILMESYKNIKRK